MGNVYILAGDYSSLPGELEYGPLIRAFRPSGDPELGDRPVALEELLRTAAERALRSTGLDDNVRGTISDLLVTTMPGTRPTGLALGLYATRLKRRLGLGLDCRTRFEVGSSDAGASVFASAVQQLESDPNPRTALVVAGQTMPRGSEAISDIARVLDPDDRRYNLNMINVGDLVFDLHLRHWGLKDAIAHLWPDGGTTEFLDTLLEHKLDLVREYPAAYRYGPRPDLDGSPWFSPWMRRCDIAAATNGACAVLLTSDAELVNRWLTKSGGRRVVRVLGVGEGEAATSVLGRPEPLVFHRAVRQALTMLCRRTGVSLDFLRGAGLAIIHDAFPSIELAFLTALGLSPLDAIQRMLTYWTNPWGGLTTFSHSMGASGLVQVVKAFHLFTRPENYVFSDYQGGETRTRHPDFTAGTGPVTCLATSVGGPLSHIVAALIQSVEVTPTQRGHALPPSFEPPSRHRFHEPLRGDFELQCGWVEQLIERHLLEITKRLGPDAAMLEARTGQYLPLLPLPLPATLLEQWTPGPVRYRTANLSLLPDEIDEWKLLLTESAAVKDVERMAVWTDRFAAKARAALTGEQLEHFEALSPKAAARELRGALFNHLRPLTGMALTCPQGQLRRVPCLLTDATADSPPGTLIRLGGEKPVQVAAAEIEAHPQLAALWTPWMPNIRLDPDEPAVLFEEEAERARVAVDGLLGTRTGHDELEEARSIALLIAQRVREGSSAPPRSARALISHLANRSSPDPAAVARALAATAGGRGRSTPKPIGFCQISLTDADASSPDAAAILSRVGQAMRRAEGWLGAATARHNRIGDTFTVSLHDASVKDNMATAVALVRFARDVYQDCVGIDLAVKIVVYVGDGRVFRDPGHPFDATSRGEAAARSLIRWGEEFQGGSGVALLRQGAPEEAGAWIDRVWNTVGGEQLEAVSAPKSGVTPRYQDLVYQVRHRRDGPGSAQPAHPLSQAQSGPKRVHLIALREDRKLTEPLRTALTDAGFHVSSGHDEANQIAGANVCVLCWTRRSSRRMRPLLRELRLAEIRQLLVGVGERYLVIAELAANLPAPTNGLSAPLELGAMPRVDASTSPDPLIEWLRR